MPISLENFCANCEHFDGDAFCALPAKDQLIAGHIGDPEKVVCEQHELRAADRRDREQLEMLEAADKAHAADQIAYENSLTGHGRY